MSAETLTLDAFVRHLPQPLRIDVGAGRRVNPGDHDAAPGWDQPVDVYRVRLTYQGRELKLQFRKGLGHHGSPPTLIEVLDCLRSDSALVDDEPRFELWAAALGFDEDSRSAERIWKQARKQRDDLETLFGGTLYALLLGCEGL